MRLAHARRFVERVPGNVENKLAKPQTAELNGVNWFDVTPQSGNTFSNEFDGRKDIKTCI